MNMLTLGSKGQQRMTDATTRPRALQTWLQAPADSKRKRDSTDDYGDDDEDAYSTGVETTSASKTMRPKKQVKSTNAAPKNTSKDAKKLYKDTLKALDKSYVALDKKVKAMDPNSRSITVDTYADNASGYVDKAEKLDAMGETVLAFNLVMALADASHRCITSFRMSGDSGDCDDSFKELDAALVKLIGKRKKPAVQLKADELPAVPHRWTHKDADVGEFKTGRPNKQQRNMIEVQYIEYEKERRAERCSRREECGDWVQGALVELKEDQKYLSDHGIGCNFLTGSGDRNCYFAESIARLEKMVAAREL
ncbi:hypothetical protein LTS10_005020 [Elasticomyces elasticus]|nr:hypothetical protein LTS10_005020 [Elasticomyces elasticus]